MVTAAENQANIKRHGKTMVKGQGPYEVMGLLDGAHVRRITSSSLVITQAVQDAALHEFKVKESVDWGFADDGKVVLKVR